MAADFIVQFIVNEKTSSKVIKLTDSSGGFTLAQGNFTVTYPDGSKRIKSDFNLSDVTAPSGFVYVDALLDSNNALVIGSYKIDYVALNASGTVYTASKSFTLDWVKPTKNILDLSDSMLPEVKFQDLTTYATSGSFTGVVTSRTFNVLMPTTSAVSGTTVTGASGLIDASVSSNYYEGVYSPKSDIVITYTHSTNSYLTVVYTDLLQTSFTIKKAPTRADLVLKINLFRAQIDAYQTTNSTQFDILNEDYDLLMSLYMHLIERAQSSTLDGSQAILNLILNILYKYVPYTYQSGPISGFYIAPAGTGTVTSVGLTAPTGFSITNSPIVGSGVIGLSFASGFSLPTDASQASWSAKQNALSGTGFVKSTAGTISYDTNTYITGNQTITLSGAVTGSGTTAITTTLANGVVDIANHSATGTPSASTILRGDNTWATYYTGTVTNVSVVTANGFTGTVATSATTPAITITTSVTGLLKGNGTSISAATAGTDYLTSVGISNLTATGTPSATTYLRGDNTWATIAGGGSGTVTSVGLSMPSAFTVSNSPVTTSGTLTVVGAGNTTQYIDGSGALQTFPTLLSADKMMTVGRNATGSILYKGTVVYISGSTGNRPNFVKAQANAESTSAGTFGVVYADIANNSDGNVVTIGVIDTLDTRSTATNPFTDVTLADGDTIYLHPTIAGYVTNVKPSAPNHLVYVGKIVRTSPTLGTIVYRIQNGYELDEIHDVQVGSYVNKDILYRDTATNLWKNASIATVLGYTPLQNNQSITLSGAVTGSGTTAITTTLANSVVGIANLSATGTASSTTYLRGDNTWATVAGGGGGTVTSVAALTLGTTGTDLSSTVANGTTAAVITLNVPTASASNRGALSSTDWSTFNSKQGAISLTTTGSSGAATFITNTLNIPTYTLAGLGGQASSTNLTSLSGLTYVSASFVKMTSAGTFALDTNTYYLASNPSGYTNNTGTVTSVAALTLGTTGTDLSSSVATGTTTAVITLNVPTASASNRGALSSTDWSTFNGKQGALTLTTTGTTGAATLVGNTLNIPQYVGGVSSFNTRTGAVTLSSTDVTTALTYTPVTNARTITINSVTYDLSADRSWTISGSGGSSIGSFSRTIQTFTATAAQTTFTISGGYTAGYIDVYVNGVRLTGADYTASNGTTVVMGVGLLVNDIVDVTIYNGIALSGTAPISFNSTTGAISISQATTSANGYLSSTDWNTFNGKQTALGYTPLNTANPAYTGILSTGTLTYTPSGLFLSAQQSANSYIQAVFQNSNAGTTASADVVVNNDLSTDSTYYGNFGMNSSGFTGSGSFNLPNATYLSATSGDLVLGTTTSNAIRFVLNGGTSDIATISGTLVSINGASVIGATSIVATAQLQVDSTTKGFLPPRMTSSQRTSITTPATGLIVYQTDSVEGLYINTSTGWRTLTMV